ncbi:MAG: tRNA uridine-5-carboxymethylaminomethyl(34) synthesis enzyme MnmG [Thermoanaerobaculia bacterium]|nr:tRNA uridine-5-carboxymethylaminomethyl(34) synthesis enzyme MnmG [Thermoanaerobaculia bacterium]
MQTRWDVVVVGGGHAGAEAALAAGRLGRKTLLLTRELSTVGRMSCNPAVGGLAKGQVVREIDALGGAMGLVADRTAIQFKVLNGSRGTAVRGPRCQSDKVLYAAEILRVLRASPNVTLGEGTAAGFFVKDGRLAGLTLEDGSTLSCGAAVVTTGTFLRGLVHVGDTRREAGRWNEPPARALSDALSSLGLRLGRMKTGTPPRVRAGTVDLAKMARAPGDERPVAFSFRSRDEAFPRQRQVDCWLTHTNEAVHDLIRESLPLSPLYSGRIVGRGPRYCPSIEDKVVRFADKPRHQIFVEPEGLSTDWLYLNGLSMSLPERIQESIVRMISGLERAEILRPAYAVEYDIVFPEQLDVSLETRALPGLFLAGQINGTSGYEEAAGQGLVAGTNASRAVTGDAPLRLGRHEAYIGVMLDDLVTLGLDEPYRLLTSRAEHRLLLGADTAYARLTGIALAFGLVTEREADPVLEAEARVARVSRALDAARVRPDRATKERLAGRGVSLTEETSLGGLLRRPGTDLDSIGELCAEMLDAGAARDLEELRPEERDRLVADLRYEGFLARERDAVARVARSSERAFPEGFVFAGLPGLSREAVEKLERHRPRTLGQASRLQGVTPAAVTLLLARLLAARPEAAA